MRTRDFSIGLRVGYILVSFVMVMEIGDVLLLYFDPVKYAACNVCFIRSFIMLVLVITGLVLIHKGMKKEHPESLYSITLGIVLLVLDVILGLYIFFKFGGAEGILEMGGKNHAIWTTVGALLNLFGIFLIVHVIHTPSRKKIIAAILAGVFLFSTVNLMLMYPKVVDFYREMEDFMEGEEEEEFNFFMQESPEPTVEEMLEKYDQGKKPLLVHFIIRCLLELIIALIFLSSIFFQRDDYDEYNNGYDSDYY